MDTVEAHQVEAYQVEAHQVEAHHIAFPLRPTGNLSYY